MTVLRNKATEKEDDRETLGEEIWRKKYEQRVSGLAGGKWRWQHKTKRGGDEWPMAYASLGRDKA